MKPSYKIVVGGSDVTSRFQGRSTEIEITDKRGMESDTMSITASDHDGRLAFPPRDAIVKIWIGWEGSLVYKGAYQVEEISHEGPADKITITGHAADMGTTMKARKERSFHKKTIGDILGQIAGEHSLSPVIESGLASKLINHIDQTHESNAHFLTRLGRQYDAIATVKDGRLLFMPKGKAATSSGKALPPFTIKRTMCGTHNYQESDRESKYTGVKTEWQSNAKGGRQTETAGSDENAKVLPKPFSTQEDAKDKAEAEWKRIQRGSATFSSSLSKGVASLIPETPILLVGWKKEITSWDWVVTQLTHTLNEGGFISKFDLEIKGQS